MKNFLMQLFDGKRENKSSRRSAICNLSLVILCGIFLTMGCGNVGKFLPSSGSGSNTNQSSNGGKPSASPIERQLQVSSVRPLKYANLQFTATKAVISDRVSDELPIDNSKPAVADITFSVVNTLKDGVAIRSGLWQLKLGDGSVYKQPYEDNFQARDTQERKISFRVPETAQWNGAQITLDEQDKEPATMLLDGNSPPPQYPINLNATGEATTKDPTITYAIQSANIDVDAFGRRAALGKRYLNLTVHIACKEGGNEFVPEFFRLLTDDAPSVPENASENNILNCPGSQDYSMAYVIPASANSVELEVGKTGVQTTAKIPIDLKSDK